MEYDRPFLSYAQQLQRLKTEYDLEIIDDGHFEKSFLNTISYYDLINGYKECFMENGKFRKGLLLSDIFVFHTIDKRFQNILFLYSVYVENIFKTKMAYLIGETRGVHFSEYLMENKYFATPKRMLKLRKTLQDILLIHTTSKENPTKFYRENHNHIPPWILFKNVNFSTMIDLFSFLSRKEKLKIISEYSFFHSNNLSEDDKIEMFRNMITTVRKFRNKIAHNYKVIGVILDKTSIHLQHFIRVCPYKLITYPEIKKRIGRGDFYSMILSILPLLENKILQLHFIDDLINFKIDGCKVYFSECGFPIDFLIRIGIIKKQILTELQNLEK